MNVQKIKSMFQQVKGIQYSLQKELEEKEFLLEKTKNKMKLLEEAQLFLQKVAQSTQEKLKFQLEDVVNLALESVFPGEYEFKILFNISRGKTEAELVFMDKRTGKPIDPTEASGGGVVDVVCFALRIACYALQQNTDNVIILDESMKFVSKDLISRTGEILKTLSEKLNLQIIMVTHIPEFIDIADRVFTVKKNAEGISEIKVS